MRQGEIWDIDFAPKIGDEIDKVRPAIVVNHDSIGVLKLKIVIPITDGIRNSKTWHVPISPSKKNGLSKTSVADCFQIKSISQARFIRKRGKLSEREMDDIKLCIMTVLDLL